MNFDTDSDSSREKKAEEPLKTKEPTITFSPAHSRFGSGQRGQSLKSFNTSIDSDFDLDLEVGHSTTIPTANIKVNQTQNQPPSTSLTDLLSPSSPSPSFSFPLSGRAPPQPPQPLPFPSTTSSSSGLQTNPTTVVHNQICSQQDTLPAVINNFNRNNSEGPIPANLGQVFQGKSLDLNPFQIPNQDTQSVNNANPCNGSSTSTTSVKVLSTGSGSLNGKMLSSNGIMSSGSSGSDGGGVAVVSSEMATSTVQLQKKLEKKIAQASAIAAAMKSMSPPEESKAQTPSGTPKYDEKEFSEWSSVIGAETSSPTTVASHSSVPNNKGDFNSNSDLSNENAISRDKAASNVLHSSTKTSKSSRAKSFLKRESDETDNVKKGVCSVRYQENEVEIISKSTRSRASGGLIPPERLAVPHKGLSNAVGIRKQSKTKVLRVDGGGCERSEKGQNASTPDTPLMSNVTSEVKPLVEWDTDESEEELSFFPTGKPRAKLTDNLSIDNLSLSGEEDDLHLSPPKAITQKCPCDPRQWVTDHIKLPKSTSFHNSQHNGQCRIC